MTPEQTINRFLENYLNDVPTPERLACYLKDGQVEVCLSGPHSFWYNPETDKIRIKKSYPCLLPINGRLIDKSILRSIYKKLTKTPSISNNEMLREKYRIDKKRIGKKELEEIAKYESAIQAHKQ